ncbi:MAG: hypothetical protein IKJ57_02430 [Oscillospiraceae bacterium]|nr:hypothetical protein [Oscillospiraceae bacterium]
MIDEKDLLLAMNGIDEKYIEESEKTVKTNLKTKTSLMLAAVLVLLFSVTAVAVASFSNTVSDGDLVFMEAMGEYSGDTYRIEFDIDVAKDSDHLLHDYYVPMLLEENTGWTDCGGSAGENHNIMCFDNYGENLYAIFFQYPAWNYDNGAAISYSVPAGTEVFESSFEIDGENLYCVGFRPCDDGFRGDPFGTKAIFWSDGYNMFVLEVRLNMDDEAVREIIRSVEKVEKISDYVKYE